MRAQPKEITEQSVPQSKMVYPILLTIGFVHFLNDAIQSIVPAMFPILSESMGLTFTQLGFLAFALNVTASLIQPVVGMYTDKKPSPYALPIGLCFTLIGVFFIAITSSYWLLVIAVILIGVGSATFHPEGSRVAYMAAGPRRGFAQSIFQVGGNSGQAMAPLITALVLVPIGQFGAIWFTIVAALAVFLLLYIAKWYSDQIKTEPFYRIKPAPTTEKKTTDTDNQKSAVIRFGIIVLLILVFVRSWYQAGMTNFYAFYLIENYQLSIQQAQIYLFLFLGAGALGTFFGGPIADRFGKKNVIAFSMLGALPFSFLLPHVNAFWAYIIAICLGFIILSSFSVTVVYAQELVPGKIGTASGLVIGLGFGMGAIGSIALGWVIDMIGITNMMLILVWFPIIGLMTMLLPSDKKLASLHRNQ